MPFLSSIGAGSSRGFGRQSGLSKRWGRSFTGVVSRNATNDIVLTISSTVGATNLFLVNSAGTSSIQVLGANTSATIYPDCRDAASKNFFTFCRANSKQALRIGPSNNTPYPNEKAIWFDLEIGSSTGTTHGLASDEMGGRVTGTTRTLSTDGIVSSNAIFAAIGAGTTGSGGTGSGGGGGGGKISYKFFATSLTSYQLNPGNVGSRKGWTGDSDGYRKAGSSLISVNGSTQVTAYGALVGRYNGQASNVNVQSPIAFSGLERNGSASGGGNPGAAGFTSGTTFDTAVTTRWYYHTGGGQQTGGSGYGAGGGGQSRDPYYGGTGNGGGGAGGWQIGNTTVTAGSGDYNNVGSGGNGTVGAAIALLVLS
jgi:hypothetical protein